MVLVSIRWESHPPDSVTKVSLSRVPVVGEVIDIGRGCLKVTDVIHVAKPTRPGEHGERAVNPSWFGSHREDDLDAKLTVEPL